VGFNDAVRKRREKLERSSGMLGGGKNHQKKNVDSRVFPQKKRCWEEGGDEKISGRKTKRARRENSPKEKLRR